MAVLVIADVPGQTTEMYDHMLAVLEPVLRQAEGFIAHGAGPSADGWRTFEVWESQADATHFFAAYVYPNLPDGIRPRRTIVELHSVVLAQAAAAGHAAETA